MDETLRVKVDRQVMSLLTISFWSNLVCIALLAAVNLLNYFRGAFGAGAESAETSGRLLSPELTLLVSAACAVWLALRAVRARRVSRRMERVFLSVDGAVISGVSLGEPSANSREYPEGRAFTIHARELRDVFSQEVVIFMKQQAPALALKTDDDLFIVPGIEGQSAVKAELLRLLQAARGEA